MDADRHPTDLPLIDFDDGLRARIAATLEAHARRTLPLDGRHHAAVALVIVDSDADRDDVEPVPEGAIARSAAEAADAFTRLGPSAVVKPRTGQHGGGVTVGVCSAAEAAEAYRRASVNGREVIVEKFVPGIDYRLLVVDGRVVAAAQLHPAAVIGDGVHDIGALVAFGMAGGVFAALIGANDQPRPALAVRCPATR